jgi:hypothetical protein
MSSIPSQFKRVAAPQAGWLELLPPRLCLGAFCLVTFAFFLLLVGVGLGVSATEFRPDTGFLDSKFHPGLGLFVIAITVMASAIGRDLAPRLRTEWARSPGTEMLRFREMVRGYPSWVSVLVPKFRRGRVGVPRQPARVQEGRRFTWWSLLGQSLLAGP